MRRLIRLQMGKKSLYLVRGLGLAGGAWELTGGYSGFGLDTGVSEGGGDDTEVSVWAGCQDVMGVG